MSLASASVFLFAASAKNRLLRQLRRLRQPRYLIATLFGMFYFWWFLAQRWMFARSRPPPRAAVLDSLELPIAAAGVLLVASSWVFGVNRSLIAFSEPEVQFLFPAPLTRRQLLQYRAARVLARTGVSALFASVLGAVLMPVSWPAYFVGIWLAFALLSLHTLGIALTELELERLGRRGKAVRASVGLVLFGALGASVATVLGRGPPPLSGDPVKWALELGREVLTTPPFSWAIEPARAVVSVAFARSAAEAAAPVLVGVALVAAHCLWVISRTAAFEERAARESEELSRRMQSGLVGAPAVRALGFSPKLAGTGRPEVALAWRALLAFVRGRGGRELLPLLLPALVIAAAVGISMRLAGAPGALPAASGVVALVVMLFGPSSLRMDFRQDLDRMDLLRTWPLPAWRIVVGQLAAPVVTLAGVEVLFAFTAALAAIAMGGGAAPGELAAAAAALAFVGPPLSAAALIVHNGIALLYPDWAQSNESFQERSFEWIGQRMLTWLGTWLVVLAAVIPAALVGGSAAALLWTVLGPFALAAGGALAGAVLAVECAFGVIALARVFDRFDVSR